MWFILFNQTSIVYSCELQNTAENLAYETCTQLHGTITLLFSDCYRSMITL